jgi:hypothetical protein
VFSSGERLTTSSLDAQSLPRFVVALACEVGGVVSVRRVVSPPPDGSGDGAVLAGFMGEMLVIGIADVLRERRQDCRLY